MRVLYGTDFSGSSRVTPTYVEASGYSRQVPTSSVVTAVSILDTQASQLRLQASRDDFLSLLVDQVVNPIDGSYVVELQNEISGATWRLKLGSPGTVGTLYPGKLVSLTNPEYPWSFFPLVRSTNRTSLGGALFSRVHYKSRTGTWNFELVSEEELVKWLDWYEVTRGFTQPFVVEDPVAQGQHYLVKSPGDFPLKRQAFGYYGGSMTVNELTF